MKYILVLLSLMLAGCYTKPDLARQALRTVMSNCDASTIQYSTKVEPPKLAFTLTCEAQK